ncbi:MAG: hypothetical protein AAF465_05825 [Pseudomonadota bacterium]
MVRKQLLWILCGVIGLWLINLLCMLMIYGKPSSPGTVGDMFGAVNALFSGLAFAFVIYAIVLQQEDLKLQRRELELTRKELQLTRNEHVRSANAQANSLIFGALASLSTRWNSLPMFRARHAVSSRYLRAGELEEGVWEIIAEFFEHLGTCLRAEAISSGIVWDTYSWYIENYWLIVKDTVVDLREEDGDPAYYERFEQLFNQMTDITKSQLGQQYNRDNDALRTFCTAEIPLAEAGIGTFSSTVAPAIITSTENST